MRIKAKTEPEVKAIVLSGGSGRRFGSGLPKQYIEICGKPILAYTLEAFEKSPVDEIVIVSGEGYEDLCRKIAKETGISKLTAVVKGGSERYYSVMEGLRFLMEKGGRNQDEIVLIHDGARPFVSAEVINDVIGQVKEYGAAIAAVPCTDTIKITDPDGMIVSTTDRSLTWAAQTPQGFRLDEIYSAYQTVLYDNDNKEQKNTASSECRTVPVTDDAMVYQLAYPHRRVKTVLSSSDNIKITSPRDLELAKTLLNQILNC